MKIKCLLFLLLAVPCIAEVRNMLPIPFAGAPSGVCGPNQTAINTATADYYDCLSGSWNKIASGTGAPFGPAGGNLGATYPNPELNIIGADVAASPAGSPTCIQGTTAHPTLASCVTYLRSVSSVSGGSIFMSKGEYITAQPWPLSFGPELTINSGQAVGGANVCNTTNPNCPITDVPLIFPSGSNVIGMGRGGLPGSGKFASGTIFVEGPNFPAALGAVTDPAYTCAASGGSLPNGHYVVRLEEVNNLDTFGGNDIVPGISQASTGTSVNCNNGGSAQSITFTSPAARGSGSFAGKGWYVLVSATTESGGSAATATVQPNGATYVSCTAGTVDGATCAASTAVTIKQTTQNASASPFWAAREFGEDTTAAMIVINGDNPITPIGGKSYPSQVGFSVGMTNVQISDYNSVGNASVAMYVQGVQEVSQINRITFNGTFTQSFMLIGNLTPNSIYTDIQMGTGAASGNFVGLYEDGRSAKGYASGGGLPQLIDRITITTTNNSSSLPVYITGDIARQTILGIHLEGGGGAGPCLKLDNSAELMLLGGIAASGCTGTLRTNTAGPLFMYGFPDVVAGASPVFEDDNFAAGGTNFKIGPSNPMQMWPLADTVIPTNNVATATVLNAAACWSGTSVNKCAAAANQNIFAGVTVSGPGSSNGSFTQQNGIVNALFDSATTAGDTFILSASTAGDFSDSGSSTKTSSTLGRVLQTNACGSPPCTVLVELEMPIGVVQPKQGGTGTDTSASTGVAQVNAGSWSFTTALANGTTATTQAASDNSTKVATTAYVTTALTPVVSFMSPGIGGVAASPVAVQNATRVWGFTVLWPTTASAICYGVNTADNTSNVYDIGVYNSSGTLIWDTTPLAGTTLFSATGILCQNFTQGSKTIQPGKYYLGWTSSAAAPAAKFNGLTSLGFMASGTPSSGNVTSGGQLVNITPPADSWTSATAEHLQFSLK